MAMDYRRLRFATGGVAPRPPNNYQAGFGGKVDGGESIDINFNAQAPTNTFQANAQAPTNGFVANAPGVIQAQSIAAPTSGFQAQTADIARSDFARAIDAAQNQVAGFGGPAQGTIANQGSLAQDLMAQARGEGPSLAQQQLQNATQAQQAQAAGQIGAIRGLNPAAAARLLSQNQAAMGQQMAGQSAALRLEEQNAARGLAANVLAQQGGLALGQQGAGAQALGVAGGLQNAQGALDIQNLNMMQGLNQQTQAQNAQNSLAAALANQQTQQAGNLAYHQGQLASMGLNAGVAQQNAQNSLATTLANQQTNAQTAAQNAQLQFGAVGLNADIASQNVSNDIAAQGIESGQQTANRASREALIGGIVGGAMQGGGAAAAGALSDARAKQNIDRQPEEVLPGVHKATFQYRDRPGTYEGVIAQDVEKVRPDLVSQGPDGMKRVHPSLAAELVRSYAGGGQVGPVDPRSYLPFQQYVGGSSAGSSIGAGLAALGGAAGAALGAGSRLPTPGEMPMTPVASTYQPAGFMPTSSALTVQGPGAYGFSEGGELDFRPGGKVPGKPKVQGDSEANDTVKAALSPGEFVVKRTTAQQPGMKEALETVNENPGRAREFVAAIKAKQDAPRSYGEALSRIRAREYSFEPEVVVGRAPPQYEFPPEEIVGEPVQSFPPETIVGRTPRQVMEERLSVFRRALAPQIARGGR